MANDRNNRLRHRILASFIIFVSLYGLYCYIGWCQIRNLSSNLLIDLVIYPQDISAKWVLLPYVDRLSFMALKQKTNVELSADFYRYGFTLYSGAIGYRDVNASVSKRRSPKEELRVRNVTKFLYQSGIKIGLDIVDPVGCTSVHQAILNADVESAKFLLNLGKMRSVPGNPSAKYAPCRKDTDLLAKDKALAVY